MLDNKRIDEAKSNIKNYLAEGLISKETFRQLVFDTYMKNHRESLNLAEHIHTNNLSNLWTIVTSYYSMFYIANAVLYKLGFKVGGKLAHKVTADALIEFVRKRLKDSLLKDYEAAKEEVLEIMQSKADAIIDSFDRERGKRSIFQYETTEEIKNSKANTSLLRARQFSIEMEKLL
ncbi:MAG: hypothetical protein NT001_04805 [Candidatus Woesearchaeota archaeon]|nr:hypothetical protein [Candidatus Woesearchaeota archaeon]